MNELTRSEWKRSAKQALVSGTAASLLSTVVMAAAGKLERNAPAGPTNGPSQWLFGRKAARYPRFKPQYTLTGFLIHHLTATGWALLHERVFGRNKATQSPARRLRNAAITATVANVVDYQLTPRRLQPGFDAQLSRKSLLAIYAAFAVGLTVYELTSRQRRRPAR